MVRAHKTVILQGALLLACLGVGAWLPATRVYAAGSPAGSQAPASASVTVPFSVEWTGTATRQLNPSTQESDIRIALVTTQAPMGLTTLLVEKFLNIQTLVIPRGTYTFTASNGDQLISMTAGTASRGDNGRVFSDETLTIMGGTGRFMGASGKIRVLSTATARLTPTGVDTLSDDVVKHMSGTVTLQESTGSVTPGCATEFTAGFNGKPASVLPLADGTIAVIERALDAYHEAFAVFNPQTLAVTEYPVPPGTNLHFMAPGPDGALWFTALSDQIGRWDPKTGNFSFVRNIVTPGSYPHEIITGPDGNIWFTEQGAVGPPLPTPPGPQGHTALAQLDLKTGVVTEFTAGLPPGNLIHTIIVGPDKNFWVTLEGVQQIARFNLATKTFDKFVQLPPGSGPRNLVPGPEGNIYIAMSDSNQVGRYNPNTGNLQTYPASVGPTPKPSMIGFTLGPDKRSIWYTLFVNGRIGRFDMVTNQITEFDCGIRPYSNPLEVAAGPDNNLWFAEEASFPDPTLSGGVARFVPPAGP